MSDIQYFTAEGFEELKNELHELKTKGRQEISRQIGEARAQGDLSENAEYDAAKDAQGMLELRINRLEHAMSKARVLEDNDLDTSKAYILSTVKVLNHKVKKEFLYTLVSENESDLKSGKISVTSPIGSGLLGKAVGDVIEIEVPSGTIKFEILEITR